MGLWVFLQSSELHVRRAFFFCKLSLNVTSQEAPPFSCWSPRRLAKCCHVNIMWPQTNRGKLLSDDRRTWGRSDDPLHLNQNQNQTAIFDHNTWTGWVESVWTLETCETVINYPLSCSCWTVQLITSPHTHTHTHSSDGGPSGLMRTKGPPRGTRSRTGPNGLPWLFHTEEVWETQKHFKH